MLRRRNLLFTSSLFGYQPKLGHDSGVSLLQQDTASLDLFEIYYLHENEDSDEFVCEPAARNQYSFYGEEIWGQVQIRPGTSSLLRNLFYENMSVSQL